MPDTLKFKIILALSYVLEKSISPSGFRNTNITISPCFLPEFELYIDFRDRENHLNFFSSILPTLSTVNIGGIHLQHLLIWLLSQSSIIAD